MPSPGLSAKLIHRGVVFGFKDPIVRQVEVAGGVANPWRYGHIVVREAQSGVSRINDDHASGGAQYCAPPAGVIT